MEVPTLTEIIKSLQLGIDNTEITDTDSGDEDNENITIPVIDTFTATVSYGTSPLTNQPFAKVTWSWSEPVLYDENNNPIDPDDPGITDDIFFDPVTNYMFGVTTAGGTPNYASTNGSLSVVTTNHALGVNLDGYVYAVLRSGIKGPVSSVTATIEKDSTPPPKPNLPVVSNYLGSMTVRNNNLDYLNAAMPADVSYVTVNMSVNGIDFTVVGRIYGVGTLTLSNLAYDVEHYFYFIAYDYSGNASDASNNASGIPRKLVELDFEPGSITETLIADDSISTPKLQANVVEAGNIAANAVQANNLESTLILTTEVLTGLATADHTRLSPEGLQIFVLSPSGVLYTLMEFVTGQPNVLALGNENGLILASISGDGSANFQTLSVADILIDGLTINEVVGARMKGIKGWYVHETNSTHVSGTDVETQWFQIGAMLEKDRIYEICVGPHMVDVDAGGAIIGSIVRYETGGVAVTNSSPSIPQVGRAKPDSTAISWTIWHRCLLSTAGQTEELLEHNFGYRLYRSGGTSTDIWGVASASNQCTATITDMGPAIAQTSVAIERTSTWSASSVMRLGTTEKLDQDPFEIGTQYTTSIWAQLIFGDNAISGETTKTISTALTGATLVKAEIIASLWPNQFSLIQTAVRPNTLTTASTTVPSGSVKYLDKTTSSKWRAWIDITDIFSVSDRGIWIGGIPADPQIYCLLEADADDPVQIRLTYLR